jgi:hypothetical protein
MVDVLSWCATRTPCCFRRKPPLVGLEHVLTGAKELESLTRN